jgi:hypothetical protein
VTFEFVGLLIAAAHFTLAFLVAATLPEAKRKGTATAGTIYIGLAIATVIWITRSAQ